MNYRRKLDEKIIGELVLLGPIGYVRAKDKLCIGIGFSVAVVNALAVNRRVKMIFVRSIIVINIGSGSNYTAVSCRSRSKLSFRKRFCRSCIRGECNRSQYR